MELEAKAPDLLLEPVWTRAAQPTEYSEITADHSAVVPHYSRFNKLGQVIYGPANKPRAPVDAESVSGAHSKSGV